MKKNYLKIASLIIFFCTALFAQDTGDLQGVLDRLGERIETTKEVVTQSGNDKAKAALDKAIVHFNKAIEFNKEGKTAETLEEIKSASAQLLKAHRLATEIKGEKPLKKMMKRLEKFIEHTKKKVEKSNDPDALKLLAEGIAHFEECKKLEAAGDIKGALTELRAASKKLAKAVAKAKGNGKFTAEKMKESVEEILKKAKEAVDKSNNKKAKDLYEKAMTTFDNGVKLMGEGKDREAVKAFRDAANEANRAIKMAKKP